MANPTFTATAQPLTGDTVDLVTTGYRWILGADRTIDFAISGGFNGEYWIDPSQISKGFGDALGLISYYADVKFNYVGSFSNPSAAAAAGAELNLTLDGADRYFTATNQWARGFFPAAQSETAYTGAAGDIYMNMNSSAGSASYAVGAAGWTVLLHEIGHALGLKHTHDDGGTGRPTLTSVGLGEADRDWVSVMSYKDDFNFNQRQWDPATPMLLDVLALQYLYGKNMSTNAGDSQFDLTTTNYYVTLWDAAGVDVVSAAGSNVGWEIYLPDDQLSGLSNSRVGYALPLGEINLASPKTFFWLIGDMEAAVGSAQSDEIYGNVLNNAILAGAGNDTVVGWDGSDYIRGDEGNDTLSGGLEFDDINGNMGNDTISGGPGADWIAGGKDQDLLFGDEDDDVVYGNLGSDTLDGGAGPDIMRGGQEDDSLSGGAGDDWLSGDRGNDTISGGAGADVFHAFVGVALDRILDFNRAEGDRVQLDAGTPYTVSQSGSDVLIDMGAGDRMLLVGVTLSALTGEWIFGA